MNNYPIGAEFDKRAPWNQEESEHGHEWLCACEVPDYEEKSVEIKDEIGYVCNDCLAEEYHDMKIHDL